MSEVWPKSLRLRRQVHRMHNLEAKVPASRWPEVKSHLVAIRAVLLKATHKSKLAE